jgi:hypothetical protein
MLFKSLWHFMMRHFLHRAKYVLFHDVKLYIGQKICGTSWGDTFYIGQKICHFMMWNFTYGKISVTSLCETLHMAKYLSLHYVKFYIGQNTCGTSTWCDTFYIEQRICGTSWCDIIYIGQKICDNSSIVKKIVTFHAKVKKKICVSSLQR